jgi:periplasmic divalent cation tolerance protein
VQENDKPVLIYSTFPSAEAAEKAGEQLVDLHLAACVNIIAEMTSIYRWEGARQRDNEAVMIIKTSKGRVDEVMAHVTCRHAYSNPALLVIPVEGGPADYLAWIAAEIMTK